MGRPNAACDCDPDPTTEVHADWCSKAVKKNPHAVALGRKGGSVTSERKAEAARINGSKGGRPTRAELFWDKVEKTDGCWLWRGCVNAQGYGNVRYAGRTRLANRVAYEFATGSEPPIGMDVCHRCDVPACVNPDHLFLGTRSDNVRDMVQKGRGNPARGDKSGARTRPDRVPRGESSGMSKLTDAIVRTIRADHAAGIATMAALARRYGVAHNTVREIVTGSSWKHVV